MKKENEFINEHYSVTAHLTKRKYVLLLAFFIQNVQKLFYALCLKNVAMYQQPTLCHYVSYPHSETLLYDKVADFGRMGSRVSTRTYRYFS